MKRFLLIPLAIVALATSALAQAPAPAPKSDKPLEVKPTGTPGKVAGQRTESITATVKAVDVANRTITLQPAKGAAETIKVSEDVKRLAEIAPGDKVVIQVQQGLLLEMQQAGSAAVTPTAAVVAERAPTTEAPGGAVAAAVQATVVVTKIDLKKRTVVVKGPKGNKYVVAVAPEAQLERLKVGDKFLATYSESVAVAVEKPKKAAPPAKKEAPAAPAAAPAAPAAAAPAAPAAAPAAPAAPATPPAK
jgi:pyruvate dehydrogenase E2 component (dihydrolipoamide acetyltransferase)